VVKSCCIVLLVADKKHTCTLFVWPNCEKQLKQRCFFAKLLVHTLKRLMLFDLNSYVLSSYFGIRIVFAGTALRVLKHFLENVV
jgi:hypothetical protein